MQNKYMCNFFKVNRKYSKKVLVIFFEIKYVLHLVSNFLKLKTLSSK